MNSTVVREIHGTKINPNHPLNTRVRKIRGGANYARKYAISSYFQRTSSQFFHTSKCTVSSATSTGRHNRSARHSSSPKSPRRELQISEDMGSDGTNRNAARRSTEPATCLSFHNTECFKKNYPISNNYI
jgi:hypothetical protein